MSCLRCGFYPIFCLNSIPPCRQTRISSLLMIFTQSMSCRIVDSSHSVILEELFSMISILNMFFSFSLMYLRKRLWLI